MALGAYPVFDTSLDALPRRSEHSMSSDDRAARSPTPSSGPAVLILGMHRSGTSAVAAALTRAGLDVGNPEHLMPPNAGNTAGYFELESVANFNDRLLHTLEWTWDAPNPAPLSTYPDRPAFVAEGRTLLQAEFGAGTPLLIKDPRISLLLPWWRQILLEQFVPIVVLRDPLEVASSLSVRDGLTIEHGVALWAAYMRHLAHGLFGSRFIAVEYADVLADPARLVPELLQALTELGVTMHFDTDAAIGAIKPELRRAVRPPPPDRVTLDTARAVKDGWKFKGVMTSDGSPRLMPDPQGWETALLVSHRRVRRLSARATELSGSVTSAGAERLSLLQHVAELERDRDELAARTQQMSTEMAAIEEQSRVLAARAASLSDEVDAHRRQDALDQQDRVALATELDRVRDEAMTITKELEAARHRAQELRTEITMLQQRADELTGRVQTQEGERDGLLSDRERLASELELLRRRVSAARGQQTRSLKKLAARDSAIDDLRGRILAVQEERDDLIQKLTAIDMDHQRISGELVRVTASKDRLEAGSRHERSLMRTRIRSAMEAASGARVDAASANQELRRALRDLDEIQDERAALRGRLEEARTEVRNVREERDEARSGLKFLDERVTLADEERDEARNGLSLLEQRVRLAEDERAALRERASILSEALGTANGRVSALAADLAIVEAERVRATGETEELRTQGDVLSTGFATARAELDASVRRSQELRDQSNEIRDLLAAVTLERNGLLTQYTRVASSHLGRLAVVWDRFAINHPRAARLVSRPLIGAWLLLTLRWPSFLRPNPLFDHTWYSYTYSDAPRGLRRAFLHYRRVGRREGRNPNPYFEAAWYLAQNSDVRESAADPLDHYLRRGWKEGRDPGPHFSSGEYLREHLELVGTGTNPLVHFLRHAGSPVRVPERTAEPDDSLKADGGVGLPEGHYRRDQSPDTALPNALARPAALSESVVVDIVPAPSRNGNGHLRTSPGTHRVESIIQNETAELTGSYSGERNGVGGLPQPATENAPETVIASLDAPAQGAVEASATMLVTGWACSRDGIESIDIYVDDGPHVQVMPGIARPDVATAFPDIPRSLESGYSIDLAIEDLEAGEHSLTVAVHDTSGNTRVLTQQFQRVDTETLYHRYFLRSLPTRDDIETYASFVATTPDVPSIVIWLKHEPNTDMASTIASLAAQDYPAWHCNVVVGADYGAQIDEVVELHAGERANRFSVVAEIDLENGREPSGTRYHGFLRAGESLAPHALVQLAMRVVESGADVIYTDHDTLDKAGRHLLPIFGPAWSPDHALSRNYVGGFYIARESQQLREAVSLLAASRTMAWRYELLTALTDAPVNVSHVPRVLWSEPIRASEREAEFAAELDIVQAALKRRGLNASVTAGQAPGVRRVTWALEQYPRVSAIVPTTGKMEYLKPLIESVLERSQYPNLEILFLDNSRGKHPEGIEYIKSKGFAVVERDEPFNWAKLNNDGARLTDGELLLFLNDDIEVTDGSWLHELVSLAVRPDVGAVGPLLLYPNGWIQHAGVFLVGHGGGAMHWLHKQDPDKGTYLDLHTIAREVSGTTGACLIVKRTLFDEVGGFDEELPIVGNDIDLCLRLGDRGYRTLWTPHTSLIHHESVSRSHHDISEDETRIRQLWEARLTVGDPYYNPNLSQLRSDCRIAWERVADRLDPSPGLPSSGVNLVGYIRAEMGVGEAARGVARALHSRHVPFVVLDYSYGNPSRQTDHSWLHMVTTNPHFDTNILCLNADVVQEAIARLPATLRSGRYNIGMWVWELPDFPDRWLSSFSVVDEIWAPSTFVRDSLANKAPVPVHRIPYAVHVPDGPFRSRQSFGLPEKRYQFLTMYDTHSIADRKNPKGALDAFFQAFHPDDESVSLVMKVNNMDAAQDADIRRLIGTRKNVFVIDQTLDRQDVASLIAVSDCFVSLHRSEGFGLVIAEAMGLGKPAIATYWSGNVDFMNDENSACIGYQLVPLEQAVGPYDAGQMWAEPNIEEASEWMVRLRNDPLLGYSLGQSGAQTIKEWFSADAVGQAIAERLVAIREGLPVHSGAV